MILHQNERADDVIAKFNSANAQIKSFVFGLGAAPTVSDCHCWLALESAKDVGWLISPSAESSSLIKIAADLSDHNPSSGGIHTIVPSELLVFPCPCEIGRAHV